jgi:hypothetical protein
MLHWATHRQEREPLSSEHVQTSIEVELNCATKPAGPAKRCSLVQGDSTDGTVDYALFEDDTYVASLPGLSTEKEVVPLGLAKIGALIMLTMAD